MTRTASSKFYVHMVVFAIADRPLSRERITLPLWRSINSINLMLPKEERKAMLLRLFNDESELVDHAKDRERAAAEARASKAQSPDVDVKEEKKADAKVNGNHSEASAGAVNGSREDDQTDQGVSLAAADAEEMGVKAEADDVKMEDATGALESS